MLPRCIRAIIPNLRNPSNPMKTVQTVAEWRQLHATYHAAGKSIGLVPTMGALHAGHVSLCEKARRECDVVVVTLFVNPTQFDESTDFENYPRTDEADREKMTTAGVDLVFVPSVAEMYPSGSDYTVQENELSRDLCGAHRLGHFTGVLRGPKGEWVPVDGALGWLGETHARW